MPNGVTHRLITGILQSITLPVSLVYADFTVVLGIQLGFGVSYFINPDLDITTNRLGIARNFGFETYRKLVPHRFGLSSKHWQKSIGSVLFFSHFPFVGTVLRWVLAILPVIIVLLFFDSLALLSIRLLFYIYIGMAISDLLHIIADIIYSARRSL